MVKSYLTPFGVVTVKDRPVFAHQFIEIQCVVVLPTSMSNKKLSKCFSYNQQRGQRWNNDRLTAVLGSRLRAVKAFSCAVYCPISHTEGQLDL